MGPDEINNAHRFFELFKARPGGLVTAKNERIQTLSRSVVFLDIIDHLNGGTAVGLCPVLNENTCLWGALDIDAHGEGERISVESIAKQITAHDLPLVICQSRRKGAHLYLFLKNPVAASYLRTQLKKYSDILAPGCEIFPKQDMIEEGRHGNSLNLPYFGDTQKCWHDGRFLSFPDFLDYAESKKTAFDVKNTIYTTPLLSTEDLKQAPPCIVDMVENGIDEGFRNESIYNFVVYARRAFPDKVTGLALDFNARFDNPLTTSEAKTAIKSASRRDYKYKCNQEPCRSRCNSAVCVTRKYGITPTNMGRNPDGSQIFTGLRRIKTSPITWELEVFGQKVCASSDVLRDFRRLSVHITEHIGKVVPLLKNDAWESILSPLMESAELVDAPVIASPSGMLMDKLTEFLNGVLVSENVHECQNAILRGYGAVVTINGKRVAAFRGTAFTEWLKRRKMDSMKPGEMWLALDAAGVEFGRYKGIDAEIEVLYCNPPISKPRKKLVIADEF